MADYQSIFTGEQIDERLSQVPNKQDKAEGKGLSSNDFTDALKAKLEGVPDNIATIGDIPTKVSDLTNDSNFQTSAQVDVKVAAETARATGEEARIEGLTDKVVLNGMTASEDGSSVQLSLAKINIKTGATSSVDVPLPVVDANGAGVLNPQTYQTIIANQTLINAIIGASVAVSGLAASPTQQQVTNAWLTASGLEELVNGARLFDVTNTKVWTYYTNTELWYPVEAEGGGSVVIAQWTNTALGTIKGVADNTGHTNDGKLTAETDGTGSVLGWDRLVSRVGDLEGAPAIQDADYVHTDNNYDDTDKGKVDSAYQKPTAGIPESDLSGSVQALLNRVFVAEYGVTTNQAIRDAFDAGKHVVCFYSNKLYSLYVLLGSTVYLTTVVTTNVYYVSVNSSDTWSNGTTAIQSTSNLVTSFGATPSDTKYPSEKLVKDSLDAKIGDAPSDGKQYARQDGAWEEVQSSSATLDNNVTKTSANGVKSSGIYSEVHPAIGSSIPSGGMLPNVLYNLGTLAGAVTMALAAVVDAMIVNHFFCTFETGANVPTITWDSTITKWAGGSAPTLKANKHYEVSVLGGVAVIMEV